MFENRAPASTRGSREACWYALKANNVHLHTAVYCNCVLTVKLFLDVGWDMSYCADDILNSAVCMNHWNITKMLLEAGIGPLVSDLQPLLDWSMDRCPIYYALLSKYC